MSQQVYGQDVGGLREVLCYVCEVVIDRRSGTSHRQSAHLNLLDPGMNASTHAMKKYNKRNIRP